MENQYDGLQDGALSEHIDEQKIISLNKFIFLCFITFGLYTIWWIYKAWVFFRQKEQTDIIPAARTIFGIVFNYELLTKILRYAKEKGYEGSYSPLLLYIGLVVIQLLSRLPDPYWLISILSFVFLIPAHNAFNYAKQNSTGFTVTEQTTFSSRQIVLIVVAAVCWALSISGFLLEEI